jgi:hypothetical protein
MERMMKTTFGIVDSCFLAMITALGGCGGFKSEGFCSDVLARGGNTDTTPCQCDNAALTNPDIKVCCKTGPSCPSGPPNPNCSVPQPTVRSAAFQALNSNGNGFILYGGDWRVQWSYINVGRMNLQPASSIGFSPAVTFTQEPPASGGDKLKLPTAMSVPWSTLRPCEAEPHTLNLPAVPVPPNGDGDRGVVVALGGVPASAAASQRVIFQNRF